MRSLEARGFAYLAGAVDLVSTAWAGGQCSSSWPARRKDLARFLRGRAPISVRCVCSASCRLADASGSSRLHKTPRSAATARSVPTAGVCPPTRAIFPPMLGARVARASLPAIQGGTTVMARRTMAARPISMTTLPTAVPARPAATRQHRCASRGPARCRLVRKASASAMVIWRSCAKPTC